MAISCIYLSIYLSIYLWICIFIDLYTAGSVSREAVLEFEEFWRRHADAPLKVCPMHISSIYRSIHLSIYLSISVYFYIYVYIHRGPSLAKQYLNSKASGVAMPPSPAQGLPKCLSHPSIFPSIYLSIYISICIFIDLYTAGSVSREAVLEFEEFWRRHADAPLKVCPISSIHLSHIYLSLYLSLDMYLYRSIYSRIRLSRSGVRVRRVLAATRRRPAQGTPGYISIYLSLYLSISIYLSMSMSIGIYLCLYTAGSVSREAVFELKSFGADTPPPRSRFALILYRYIYRCRSIARYLYM